jgi:phage terminase small subunit
MRTISIFRAGDGAGTRRNKEADEVRDFCRLRWASDRDATERSHHAGELASLKLLTNLDRAALAAYCGSYALWTEAIEAI